MVKGLNSWSLGLVKRSEDTHALITDNSLMRPIDSPSTVLRHDENQYRSRKTPISMTSDIGSQSAVAAFGGYILPSTSTFGSQVHLSSSGMESMTVGICWPQPHQEAFSGRA